MKRTIVVLCLFSLVLVGHAMVRASTSDLIAEADAMFDRWTQPFVFSVYQEQLETAVALWEEALLGLPEDATQTRSHVLNGLAEAYFELGEAYLFDPAEREAAYGKGKDHALASLRLDPLFDAIEASEGFRAALNSASDVKAIFWYGNTLGQWLNYHQFTAILGGVLDVLASYERAVELDETYLGGGPRRSLAALIAQAYFVIGKSREESVCHYEQSIEIDPAYLESYVNYAQHYADPMNENELFNDLLDTLRELAQDPQVVAKWPFYNELAIRRADSLDP